jgi:prepilin-type N-terminal cleavage/methylation domain-containing protein
MAKRAQKMIYSAPMRTDCVECKESNVMRSNMGISKTQYPVLSARRGFTMIELMVVIVVVALFAFMAQVHLFGLLRKGTFKAQVQELISTMQMAARAAAESDRRYEVIIDLPAQRYTLRQITSPDLSQVLEEEIIIENFFSENCRAYYVWFDDGEFTNDDRAKFRAGHSGWQYGGKIVLLDENEQPYSIVVNRMNRMITLERGDVELIGPKTKDEMVF